MSEQLIIRLPERAELPVSWLVWQATEKTIIAAGELASVAELSSLHERAGGRKVLVTVPATQVGIYQVTLPGKATRAVLKAVPYMLEEQLAEDIDGLHFALGERQGLQQQVLVVRDSVMQQWQQWLSDAALLPQRMVPEQLAMPVAPATWSALHTPNGWLVRTSTTHSFVATADNLALFVELQQQQLAEPLQQIQVLGEWPLALEGVEVEPFEQTLPLELAICHWPSRQQDLLQGTYAPKRESNKALLPWRKVGILAGVLFVLALISMGAQIVELNAAKARLKTQSQGVYLTAFPEDKALFKPGSKRNPRTLMRAKMRTLGSAAGGSTHFLAMIQKLTPAFVAVPDLEPDSLRYEAKRAEVRLMATANNFQSFEKFKNAVASEFAVETGSMTNQGEQVRGSLTIRRQ